MIHDTPEGTTHLENDGCGIKEHNMTLREKWRKWYITPLRKDRSDVAIYDFFLTQFDAMLAEDISAFQKSIDMFPKHRNAYENGVWVALTGAVKILEARRLSLKK